MKEHQGGKFYDCNDNGRARAAGHSQECIDKVLSKPNPFGNGKKVTVRRNWGPCGNCKCKKERTNEAREPRRKTKITRRNVLFIWKSIQGGKFYDCNDNGRARAAGNSQACIDKVLSKPNPFGNGKKVTVRRNWGSQKWSLQMNTIMPKIASILIKNSVRRNCFFYYYKLS